MRFVTQERAFLPFLDPLEKMENPDLKGLEELAANMPKLLSERKFCKEVDNHLHLFDFPFIKEQEIDRLMLIYSYFASAYVHENVKNPAKRIPKSVAYPLSRLAKKLDRPPILSYDSYCLNNWKRINVNKPIELGNIVLLQNFLGGEDEDWFILVHVEIEARSNKIIKGIFQIRSQTYLRKDPKIIIKSLNLISEGIKDINQTLARMPEQCSPDIYFHRVRPYIFSFENVIYEGVYDKPISYRGETGAQSAVVPAIVSGLNIKHQDSMLTKHLKDMRKYMPVEHRKFLSAIEENDIRKDVRKYVTVLKNQEVKDAYNRCIEELLGFRELHLQYAIDYIQRKVDNPTGTGGTPYIAWLGKLRDETKNHFV